MERMNAPMSERNELDPPRLKMLQERMRLATDMAETVEWLRGQGFTDRAILAGFEAVRPRGDALQQNFTMPPLLKRAPAKLRKVDTDKLDLYLFDDFMSANGCAKLIALCAHHLRPSTLAYVVKDDSFRTSTTADLCHLKSPIATAIDDKICRTLGIRESYSEGIQAQRYDVGQQFKPHCDYFEPNTQVYQRFAGVRGNRTWTFMVYLNDGMEGGATRFTEIDYAVQPKTGLALLWNNLKPDGTPNENTRHAGEPVTRGHKTIITKWFRVFGDGPLFY
jgi:prolyl 4-hydroxylase